jgi:hypothetical protein
VSVGAGEIASVASVPRGIAANIAKLPDLLCGKANLAFKQR